MNSFTLIKEGEIALKSVFESFEEIAFKNQEKVLDAFRSNRIRDVHFNTSSGYGYGDIGRDDLEQVFADIFYAENAMVRGQIVSGTHAISACLFGLLRTGDHLISLTGKPYDTLGHIIGNENPARGTLVERGINYTEIDLTPVGHVDLAAIEKAIHRNTKMVLIQRSRGYNHRPALTIQDISDIIRVVRKGNPKTIIFIDNCYGEFTDLKEPVEIGADLVAGSLIKNAGGGLALSGGYIAGKHDLVEEVACHVTAPGLGKELGASLMNNRLLYQGLFLAPHVVLQALKSAALLSYVFEQLEYEVYPHWNASRGDIVQAVQLNSPEKVIEFTQIVQRYSPIDSDVNLEFAELPGYDDQVIMAAGTFVQGSSIELSCDAPLRSPYTAYFQGGLTYEHTRYVIAKLADSFMNK
ncbi:MAG: methionine gamma-lyase family protein [Bacillota bacterium]|nr:methionine gamma-lyase family protein [Bacillota bacterium]